MKNKILAISIFFILQSNFVFGCGIRNDTSTDLIDRCIQRGDWMSGTRVSNTYEDTILTASIISGNASNSLYIAKKANALKSSILTQTQKSNINSPLMLAIDRVWTVSEAEDGWTDLIKYLLTAHQDYSIKGGGDGTYNYWQIVNNQHHAKEVRDLYRTLIIKNFQDYLMSGDESNIGLVIERKGNIAKIQTTKTVFDTYTEWVEKYDWKVERMADVPETRTSSKDILIEEWVKVQALVPYGF